MSLIPAATVILVREGAEGLEVFLLKRHRASSFMSNAYVFPGGKVDAEDDGHETAAIRELFEEAGVLLATPPMSEDERAAARGRLLAGEVSFAQVLSGASLTPDLSRLHWWARWVTPSQEPRRFDAVFFVAELPPGQRPSFDQKETVEELWITPAQAIEKQATGELRLPPPQLRTMHDLVAAGSIEGIAAAAARRQESRPAICPRISMGEGGIQILLPWDPDYEGTPGEGQAIAANDAAAGAPTRFIWGGQAWRVM